MMGREIPCEHLHVLVLRVIYKKSGINRKKNREVTQKYYDRPEQKAPAAFPTPFLFLQNSYRNIVFFSRISLRQASPARQIPQNRTASVKITPHMKIPPHIPASPKGTLPRKSSAVPKIMHIEKSPPTHPGQNHLAPLFESPFWSSPSSSRKRKKNKKNRKRYCLCIQSIPVLYEA